MTQQIRYNIFLISASYLILGLNTSFILLILCSTYIFPSKFMVIFSFAILLKSFFGTLELIKCTTINLLYYYINHQDELKKSFSRIQKVYETRTNPQIIIILYNTTTSIINICNTLKDYSKSLLTSINQYLFENYKLLDNIIMDNPIATPIKDINKFNDEYNQYSNTMEELDSLISDKDIHMMQKDTARMEQTLAFMNSMFSSNMNNMNNLRNKKN